METQQNNISSQAKLSAIVGMMFCAPLVKPNINGNADFSEEEKIFIMWYIQIWFVNLALLVITLIAYIVNIFWMHPILSRIIRIGSVAIYIITVFSLFACANDLTMRKPNEKVVTHIQNKWQLLKSYIPIMNFISWFRQENYNMPYRWLKESILLRTIFIFWTLILWNYFWIWVLSVIIVRISLLMMNIDIIPISIKKAINSIFYCNPWEIFAYLFATIISKLKKSDYNTVLQARKQWYVQWQVFWIGIIIQYLAFMAIIYLIYRDNLYISRDQIILLFAAVLWIIRVIMFYRYKKAILRIPILSEIVSLFSIK